MSALGRLLRRAYKEERLPATARWVMTAAGMRDWMQLLRRQLRPHLGEQRDAVMDALTAELFARRHAALVERHPSLDDGAPRTLALLMSGLYLLPFAPRRRWIVASLGGGPQTPREHARALALTRRLPVEERWRELTVHLGELLIVATERLPERLPRARPIVAQLCFDMGVAYARDMSRALELSPDTPVANAIEVLRTSEYLFRVNPEHESGADEARGRGFIDGSACPWYSRPGWGPHHCGIFGQFQAGVCSVFELRYSLTTTIPKHGGDHCRVDLTPLRRPAKA
ncbi:MAG: hypothetical protein R3A51_16655 [Nannocystaceae bacterium]